jgi:hypothetical protein
MTWRLIRPIWRLADVTANQRLVLLALASFTDERGANAYPSQGTLARMCCCTTRTIRRALSELIAMRIIVPNGKARGGAVRYSVNVNVLPTQDSHVRPHRTPMSYNPSKRKPSESYPRDSKDSQDSKTLRGDSFFDSDSGNTRQYRAPDSTRQPGETVSDSLNRLWREQKAKTRN